MARILTFGKYKFQKIIDIIDSDPEYISWATNNVRYFKLTLSEKTRLTQKLNETC